MWGTRSAGRLDDPPGCGGRFGNHCPVDPGCTVSKHLLDLGWKLAIFDERTMHWTSVTTLDAVRAMKTDPARGYNVLSWAGDLQASLRPALQPADR